GCALSRLRFALEAAHYRACASRFRLRASLDVSRCRAHAPRDVSRCRAHAPRDVSRCDAHAPRALALRGTCCSQRSCYSFLFRAAETDGGGTEIRITKVPGIDRVDIRGA